MTNRVAVAKSKRDESSNMYELQKINRTIECKIPRIIDTFIIHEHEYMIFLYETNYLYEMSH